MRASPDPAQRWSVTRLLSKRLDVPVQQARAVVNAAPLVLPGDCAEANGRELVFLLSRGGGAAELVPSTPPAPCCIVHSGLSSAGTCKDCRGPICVVCFAQRRRWRCERCFRRRRRRRQLFAARVSVLLVLLMITTGWAVITKGRRAFRTSWAQPVPVSVIVLTRGHVSTTSLVALRQGLQSLNGWFASEFQRYRGGHGRPFDIRVVGPFVVEEVPPAPPEEEDLLARARYVVDLNRYLSRLHEKIGDPGAGRELRLYMSVEADMQSGMDRAEGAAAAGGEVGLVYASVEDEDATLAVMALAHELLHCVGATDKYGPDGHAVDQSGLVEPRRVPRYPQNFAELMVGEISTSPTGGRLPDTMNQVRVGPSTAAEIRWVDGP